MNMYDEYKRLRKEIWDRAQALRDKGEGLFTAYSMAKRECLMEEIMFIENDKSGSPRSTSDQLDSMKAVVYTMLSVDDEPRG